MAGCFDAVLLRPTPLLIAAVLVGATAPLAAPVVLGRAWTGGIAAALALAASAFALVLSPVVESAMHQRAYHRRGDIEELERAAEATPDDYRLQLALALR